MLVGIDHLVVVVEDLPAAMQGYEQLGFETVPGGRHTTCTHNALVPFADGSYLELIAFYEPCPAHRWWEPLRRGGGLVDLCLRATDFRRDAAALARAGIPFDEPAPLTRTRPDGFVIRWVLATPRAPFVGVAPFLIEDETPRAERVPAAPPHPNGVTGIDTVTVVVDDAAPLGRAFAAAGAPVEPARRGDLGAAGVRVAVGPHRLEFLVPEDPAGPLAGWRRARGASPYAATLAAQPGTEPRTLARDLACGAGLAITPLTGRG